jgi:hypothetical protein
MPTDTKQIKFEIVGDARALNQTLEQAVRQVQNFAKQIAQATGGMIGGNLGTGGPIIPGANNTGQQGAQAANSAIIRTVEENKKILDSLKGASTNTLRTMADMAQREIDREKKAIDSLSASLENLNRRYDQISKIRDILKDNPAGQQYADEANRVFGKVKDLNDQRQRSEENLGVNQQIVDSANPPPPPGFFGKLGAAASGLFGRGGMRALGGAAAVNMVGDLVTTLASESVRQRFDVSNAAVMQAQAFKQPGLATRQGDLSYALALARMGNGSREDMDSLGHSGFARGVSIGGQHFGSLGALFRTITSPASAIADGVRSGRMMDSEMKRDVSARLQADIASDPTFFAHAGEFRAQAGSRVAMMRAAGVGAQGLNSLLSKGNSLGFGDEQVFGEYSAIANRIGRQGAKKLTQAVLQGMTTGMDQGVLTQLATSGAMSGNGDLAGLMASQGQMNLAARNSIGGFLASQAVNQFGAGDVSGMMGMLSFGTGGGAKGALAAEQNIAGVGGMNQLLSGAYDPYQKGMNWLYASRNAGKNASLYTMKALATGLDARTLSSVMAGGKNLPDHLRAAGVTPDMIKGQWNDVTGSILDRIIPGGETPMEQAAKALRGGDFMTKLKSYVGKGKGMDNRIGNVAALFSNAYDLDMNTAAGEVRNMLGLGRKGKMGKGGGDAAGGSHELEELKQQVFTYAKEARLAFESVGKLLEKLNAELGPNAIEQVGNTFERLGDLDVSAEQAAEKLNKLTGAANRAADSVDKMAHAPDTSKTGTFYDQLSGAVIGVGG